MRPKTRVYAAWVRGELVLVTLLGGALALVLAIPSFRPASELPALRLFLDTGVALLALVVSVLAYVRLSVEGRRFDLFLASGFSVAARRPGAARTSASAAPSSDTRTSSSRTQTA